MSDRTIQDLWQLQGLPLNLKIRMTKDRIRQWIQTYGEDGVYVSFSGGKDSTVLLHIVREEYPNVKAVFVDTGLEYPEIRQFVKTFDNVDWIKPKMNFKAVIQKYGYPFISKEVSECVYGARRYLTSVLKQASLDRQTDRQTDRASLSLQTGETHRMRYLYEWEKLQGTGRYGKQCAIAKLGGGGPALRFANLTGIRTVEGGTNPKLWSHYRQFSDSASDGDSSSDRQSDSGEYP